MSRYSRFEKLENERQPAREEERPSPSLERFTEEAPAARPAAEPEPAVPAALPRFGEEGLRTFEDELSKLPTLECAMCGSEASKFDVACFRCGARLDTPEARAHNLKRLEAITDARRAEAAQIEQAREEELQQLRERRREEADAAAEAIIAAHRPTAPSKVSLVVWGFIAVFSLAAYYAPLIWPKLVLAVIAFVLLLTRIPLGAWKVLGKDVTTRW